MLPQVGLGDLDSHVAPPPSQPPPTCLPHCPFGSTARLEAPALAGHVLPVPVFVDRLIKKILAGDTDAMDLTGSGRKLLQGDGAARVPPTAIRAQYFWFNFTSNSSSSNWWQRSEIPNNPALIYTQAHDRCASGVPVHACPMSPSRSLSSRRCNRWPTARSSAAYRPHILSAAAVSAAASIASACTSSLTQQQRAAALFSALVYAVAFAATLICPSLPVSPSSLQVDGAAAAAHVINVYVVGGLCSTAAAASALAQQPIVIKASLHDAFYFAALQCDTRQACACAFVLLNVLSNRALLF